MLTTIYFHRIVFCIRLLFSIYIGLIVFQWFLDASNKGRPGDRGVAARELVVAHLASANLPFPVRIRSSRGGTDVCNPWLLQQLFGSCLRVELDAIITAPQDAALLVQYAFVLENKLKDICQFNKELRREFVTESAAMLGCSGSRKSYEVTLVINSVKPASKEDFMKQDAKRWWADREVLSVVFRSSFTGDF